MSAAAPGGGGGLGRREFIGFLSMVMALAALGIDMMLPAFGDLRRDFGLAPDSNEVARTVTAYFLGMAVAPIAYGVLADRYGRKPVLYLGGGIYMAGAALSALAPSLPVLLAARFLWGVGAAGGRVVAMAIVRDTQRGDQMARTMSYMMTVFILVPVLAPAAGAGIVALGSWRFVFWVAAATASALLLWSRRLGETLEAANRRSLRIGQLRAAVVRLGSTPATVVPTLALTCLMGVMASYLASSQLMISEIFGRGDQFPLVFGAVAIVLGAASFLNGKLVGRIGIRPMLAPITTVYLAAGAGAVAIAVAADGEPGFWVFMPVLTAALACQMLLIPNLNTLAMEPVGDIAGTAAAVVGSFSTAGGAVIGSVVDTQLGPTVTPLAVAVLAAGVVIWVLAGWLRRTEPIPLAATAAGSVQPGRPHPHRAGADAAGDGA